ncbi:hypothetical protein HDU92_000339 [Lobulomyces angularis]|nr:hypothetical protein HDU92_000339 [Lobulomyces angularis]
MSGPTQDPAMLAMLQHRLDSLAGQPSDYIKNLPENVQKRLRALKNLQDDHLNIENEFEAEVLALEKKYFNKYNPLYVKRQKIISGQYEPTDAESEREPEDEASIVEIKDEDALIKGIPEFWSTCLKNSPEFQELITEKDEEALKFLTDIRYSYLKEGMGFKLEFEFSSNDFFTNSVLTKTYYLNKPEGSSPMMFDRAEGSKIDWKENKNLTVTVEVKKQRHKNTNKTRTVKRTVPTDSFFNFFSPPTYPTDNEKDEEIDDAEDLEQRIEIDYENGEFLKEKLIPNAVYWFTGDAIEMDGYDFGDEGEFEDGDEDDDGDDDDDDDDDGAPGAEPAEKPECKQQ